MHCNTENTCLRFTNRVNFNGYYGDQDLVLLEVTAFVTTTIPGCKPHEVTNTGTHCGYSYVFNGRFVVTLNRTKRNRSRAPQKPEKDLGAKLAQYELEGFWLFTVDIFVFVIPLDLRHGHICI